MTDEPKFGEDLVNLAYLDKRLGEETENVEKLGYSKNFGSQPIPPYRVNDTYMNGNEIYVCITERLIGDFDINDWQKASNYKRNFTTTPAPPYDIGDTWRKLNDDGTSYDMYICKTAKDETESYNVSDWETIKDNAYIPGSNIKIIGTSGVLTQLMIYSNISSAMFLGGAMLLPMGYSFPEAPKDSLQFTFTLPANFVIVDAKITISHVPTKWYNAGSYKYDGYSRNLKLYKISGNPTGYMRVDDGFGFYDSSTAGTWSQIANAFGVNGFTGNVSGYSESTSIDIKSNINSGFNMLKIESSNGIPGDYDDCKRQTGACAARLDIIGYAKFS